MSKTISITTDVDVYLDEISSEDLIEELSSRGYMISQSDDAISIISKLYEKAQLRLDYSNELRDLIYNTIGRIL